MQSTTRRRQYRPTFYCHNCRQTCAAPPQGQCGGTGYATTASGNRVCYACCAKIDTRDMRRTGRACLYLSGHGARVGGMAPGEYRPTVSNWPGSLKINCHVTTGRHNIARCQYRVSFTGPDGKAWYGVTYGDNTQICHCRRAKVQPRG